MSNATDLQRLADDLQYLAEHVLGIPDAEVDALNGYLWIRDPTGARWQKNIWFPAKRAVTLSSCLDALKEKKLTQDKWQYKEYSMHPWRLEALFTWDREQDCFRGEGLTRLAALADVCRQAGIGREDEDDE